MSEDNTTFSSHSSCDQQVHSDVDAVRSAIDALLADVEHVSVMTPLDHLDWALALPLCMGISRPPEMLRRAVHRSRAFGHCGLEAYRQKTLVSWFERKRVLDPAWQRLWEQLPSHVRQVLGPKRNLLLLREMLVAAGYADETLVADLAQGFPLIGKLPRSNTLPEVSYPLVEETRESLLWQASWRNEEILSRVAASFVSDVEVAAELDAKSQSEVESGKASEVPLAEVVKRCVVTPRFPVDEGWRWKNDNWARRVRCIDDFTASFINAATAPGESIHHDTLDVLVALLHSAGKNRRHVRFREDDFVGAYKTLPLRLEDLQLAVTVWRDASGSLRTLQLHCCPFGAVASVHAWHRLGAAVQCILANLFLVVYARYVDDLFSLDEVEQPDLVSDFIGPTGTATLARQVIQELLGWELDAEKAVTNANVFVALGVQIEYVDRSQTMIFRVTEERAAKWRVEIQGYLLSQRMLPSQARKLAGKLSWGASYVFGRGARVYLVPLFYHASRSSRCLSKRLQATLKWWLCFLESVPVRRIPSSPVPSVVLTLYADATGCGTVAWVAMGLSKRVFSREFVPEPLRQWVQQRQQQIATWELVPALCAVWYFLRSPARLSACHLQINLFIDSNVALDTLLRGTSRQSDWNDLVAGIWFEAAAQAALLLAWRVPSKLNLADAPTRPEKCASELRALIDRGFVETEWWWPPHSPWLM